MREILFPLPPLRGRVRVGGPSRNLAALVLLFSLAAHANEAPEFTATVDRTEIALDEIVQLDISVTLAGRGETGETQLPTFHDFDVVSRSQMEQTSFVFANGTPQLKRTTIFQLALKPRHAGSATIEPAILTWRGQRYQTNAVAITISPPGSGAPRPQSQQQRGRPPGFIDPFAEPDLFGDPFAQAPPAANDVVLRAVVDKPKAYVGEQITLSLYLLSRVDISGVQKLSLPKLDGFWSEEIETPTQLVPETRYLGGLPYRAYLLKRRALFPLKPGALAIDSAEVEVVSGGFGMMFGGQSVRRASAAISVEAQPLPSDGKPASFPPNNVGSWHITLEAEPREVPLGQPVTIKLLAEGRGNARALVLPRLPAIDGIRAYDPTTKDSVRAVHGHIAGKREIDQLVVPEKTGTLTIPSLEIATFDPATHRYELAHTPPIELHVGAGAAPSAELPRAETPAQNILEGGLKPLRYHATLEPKRPPLYRRPFFVPLAATPLALALLTMMWGPLAGLFRSNPDDRRTKQARHRARARLKNAERLSATGERATFIAEVQRTLDEYVETRLGIPERGLTRDALTAALETRGVPTAVSKRLCTLLDTCDQARFAGGDGAPLETTLHDALGVLTALEANAKR